MLANVFHADDSDSPLLASFPDTLVILPNGGHGGENTPLEVSEKVNAAMYKWILKYSK